MIQSMIFMYNRCDLFHITSNDNCIDCTMLSIGIILSNTKSIYFKNHLHKKYNNILNKMILQEFLIIFNKLLLILLHLKINNKWKGAGRSPANPGFGHLVRFWNTFFIYIYKNIGILNIVYLNYDIWVHFY